MQLLELLKSSGYFTNEELIALTLLKNQGYNNTNYKLTTSKKEYLIRLFGSQDEIDRTMEYTVALKAHRKSIAAKPLFLDIQNSLMICDFTKGIHKYKLTKKDIRNLAYTLQKMHQIQVATKPYNLIKAYQSYNKKVLGKNLYKINRVFKSLKTYTPEYVLCHHDLNPKNILFTNKVKFIDWEYAGINDRYFDLACLFTEFQMSLNEQKYFLSFYFTCKDKIHKKKLQTYTTVYNTLCSLWFDNNSTI